MLSTYFKNFYGFLFISKNYVNKPTMKANGFVYSSSDGIGSASVLSALLSPFSVVGFRLAVSVSDLLSPTNNDFKNCVHRKFTGAIV